MEKNNSSTPEIGIYYEKNIGKKQGKDPYCPNPEAHKEFIENIFNTKKEEKYSCNCEECSKKETCGKYNK